MSPYPADYYSGLAASIPVFWAENDAEAGMYTTTAQMYYTTTAWGYSPTVMRLDPPKKRRDPMAHDSKLRNYIFEGIAVKRPESWDHVTPEMGKVFALPKVLLGPKLIIAKDHASAVKQMFMQCSSMADPDQKEGGAVDVIDPERIEVLCRPFLEEDCD